MHMASLSKANNSSCHLGWIGSLLCRVVQDVDEGERGVVRDCVSPKRRLFSEQFELQTQHDINPLDANGAPLGEYDISVPSSHMPPATTAPRYATAVCQQFEACALDPA